MKNSPTLPCGGRGRRRRTGCRGSAGARWCGTRAARSPPARPRGRRRSADRWREPPCGGPGSAGPPQARPPRRPRRPPAPSRLRRQPWPPPCRPRPRAGSGVWSGPAGLPFVPCCAGRWAWGTSSSAPRAGTPGLNRFRGKRATPREHRFDHNPHPPGRNHHPPGRIRAGSVRARPRPAVVAGRPDRPRRPGQGRLRRSEEGCVQLGRGAAPRPAPRCRSRRAVRVSGGGGGRRRPSRGSAPGRRRSARRRGCRGGAGRGRPGARSA